MFYVHNYIILMGIWAWSILDLGPITTIKWFVPESCKLVTKKHGPRLQPYIHPSQTTTTRKILEIVVVVIKPLSHPYVAANLGPTLFFLNPIEVHIHCNSTIYHLFPHYCIQSHCWYPPSLVH